MDGLNEQAQESGFPPMTPAQQEEALRLAARLQAEHEASMTQNMIRAAEEAGIERRFLDAAVTQVVSRRPRTPFTFSLTGLISGTSLVAIVIASAIAIAIAPLIGFAVALSFLAGLFPTGMDRTRLQTFGFVAAAWLILDLLFALAGGDVRGEFTNVGFAQLGGTIVGIELVRLAFRLRGTLPRPNESLHRPQSQ